MNLVVYGVYFWNPFHKYYEYSLISRDLENCLERYKSRRKESGFLLQTKKGGPTLKATLSKEDAKKNYIVIEERNATSKIT